MLHGLRVRQGHGWVIVDVELGLESCPFRVYASRVDHGCGQAQDFFSGLEASGCARASRGAVSSH